MDNAIRTTYVNLWSAPGLLGGPTRYHSSVEYETAHEACIGREVPPGDRFTLLGTLDLRPGRGQPRFIAYAALLERVHTEQRVAAGEAA